MNLSEYQWVSETTYLNGNKTHFRPIKFIHFCELH